MAEFFSTYGFLIVSMILAAMLALSLYLPLMAGQLSLASPGFYALGAFIALREDELAASAMGINPTYNKVLAFTLGAVLAGIVGAVSAHFLNTWNARQGTFDVSIIILAYVLIGGSRTFLGPVVGGMVL